MKNRFSLSFTLLLCIFCFENISAQATCIKLKNGSQRTYPTSCIKKISFSNNQIFIDLINPTPVIISIDSIQKIYFNQTLTIHEPMESDGLKIERSSQLLTLYTTKNEKNISIIRTLLVTI